MSIILIGQTTCPLCGKNINEGDHYYGFPAFVNNTKDKLYVYNDAAFHQPCLRESAHGALAIEMAETFIEKVSPINRRCIVTGEPILHFEDHIFTGYLTSNPADALYPFNFIHLDKQHLFRWKDREALIAELEAFLNSGQWDDVTGGDYLRKLILMLGG